MKAKKILEIANNYLANIKVKQKLLLSYFILIIIPLSVLTLLSYNLVSGAIQKQTKETAKQAFEQASTFLAFKINNAINTLNLVILDRDTSGGSTGYTTGDVLRRGTDLENYGIPKQVEDMKNLTRFLNNLKKNASIYRIRLYVHDGLIYSDENDNFYNIEKIKSTIWYKKLTSIKHSILWCPASYLEYTGKDTAVISAVQLFKNPYKLKESIGIARVDILQKDIDDIVTKANIVNTGAVYLVNESGEMISADASSSGIRSSDLKKYYEELQESGWYTANIRGKEVIVGAKNIPNTNWKLVSVIPLKEILASSKSMRNFMVIYMILIAVISYLLAYFISDSSTKRIAQLTRRMRRVQNGDMDVIITKQGSDEIGELIENFNYMIKKIAVLIDQQYKSGQEVKNAELKALQAQINPHFLYNTLDSINWMAIRHKVPDISYMVQVLAKYYKLSLSKGKDIVSIKDEIMHVTTYVEIQNKRFEDAIKLELDIDENTFEYKTLKILLQPIVENSIIHGILQKESKNGTIRISVKLDKGIITICVKDDGLGMTQERLNELFSLESSDQHHGYGIKNINERVKLYYGDQYGILYKSEVNKGTTVEIKIPAVKSK